MKASAGCMPYRAVLRLERRASHEGMVSVGGNLYSVPDTTRRRVFDVHVLADAIHIFEDGVARRDPRPSGRARRETARSLRIASSHRLVPTSSTRSRNLPILTRAGDRVVRRSLDFYAAVGRRLAGLRRRPMSAPSVIERVKTQRSSALKMPRALEMLDATLRRIEQGEIDQRHRGNRRSSRRGTQVCARTVGSRRRCAWPGLPILKTLAGFDFSFQPSLDRNRIMALAGLDFINRAEVVPPAGAARHRQIPSPPRHSPLKPFAPAKASTSSRWPIFAILAKAEREGVLREKIRFLCRCSLLVVDEIGYLPVTPGGGNLFFQLVNARYEKGAMILTSNRGFAEWGDIFGDSRRRHRASRPTCFTTPSLLQIEGSSYRLREHADLLPETRPLQSPHASHQCPSRRL